jgi:hypothetical protein
VDGRSLRNDAWRWIRSVRSLRSGVSLGGVETLLEVFVSWGRSREVLRGYGFGYWIGAFSVEEFGDCYLF